MLRAGPAGAAWPPARFECSLQPKHVPSSFRSSFPNVTRYFTTLIHQPQFSKVLGHFELCKVALKRDH